MGGWRMREYRDFIIGLAVTFIGSFVIGCLI